MKTKRFKKDLVALIGVVILFIVGSALIYVGLFVDKDVITTNKGDFINYGDIRPPTVIVFEYMGKEVGQLEWGSGKFKFVGEADQSAKIFFKYFLKPYIDEYIEDEVKRRKE